MQRSDTRTQASGTIKGVIVIETDVHNAFLPENAHHAIRQGSLARSTVTTNRHNERLLSPGNILHTLQPSRLAFVRICLARMHTLHLSEQHTSKGMSLLHATPDAGQTIHR